ncbi:MAG: DUF3604 domain-containing protein [Armatimonadota bacterium]|nr:DUF3604 domain-containing protein [Armatimonadota bacterium]
MFAKLGYGKTQLEREGKPAGRSRRLDGAAGWTEPAVLLKQLTLGRIAKPAVAHAEESSFWVAWQGDNYLMAGTLVEDVTSQVRVAKVKFPAPESKWETVRLEKASAGARPSRQFGRPSVERRKVIAGGEEFTLLFGNLHEHTLISRCWASGADGTFDDNYRHGVDMEGYDFMALTDHGYDLYEAAWRKSRRNAQLYDDPPYFVALPAYEWTLSGEDCPPSSGHRNIIFSSDEDAAKFVWEGKAVYGKTLPVSNQMDKVWRLLRDKGIRAVTIPHHPADLNHPMDWDFHDDEYQRVVEIFQCRGSGEHENCPKPMRNLTKHKGSYVQDALARGYRIGFVASGDHNAMGIGLAAVLVKEVSRKGIVDALLARRCYATTGDKIFLDFSVDGKLMGEEIIAGVKPRITATINATQPISNIVIFKNNKIIYERTRMRSVRRTISRSISSIRTILKTATTTCA